MYVCNVMYVYYVCMRALCVCMLRVRVIHIRFVCMLCYVFVYVGYIYVSLYVVYVC